MIEDNHNPDNKLELMAQSDVSFHGILVAKVENSIYFRLYRMIEDMALRIRTLVINQSAEKIEIINQEHATIINALKQKDVDLAHKNLLQHLSNAFNRTLVAVQLLEKQNPPPNNR